MYTYIVTVRGLAYYLKLVEWKLIISLSQEGVATCVYGRHVCETQSPPQLQGSIPCFGCYRVVLIAAVASNKLVRSSKQPETC